MIPQAKNNVPKSADSETESCTVFLPDLGDDVAEGKILTLAFSPGDKVTVGETLAEVETDKVVLEIPADCAGTLLHWQVGVDDMVSPGMALVQLQPEVKVEGVLNSLEQTNQPEDMSPVALKTPAPVEPLLRDSATELKEYGVTSHRASHIAAGPSARRLAREIGVDLQQVTGSGPRNRISKADVKAYAKQQNGLHRSTFSQAESAAKPLPDLAAFGPVHRQSTTTIEQATATHMSHAWSQVPHAWLQEKVDITKLEESRQKYKDQVKSKGGALTLTAILVKALALALQEFPIFNAALDKTSNELVYRDYCHIGIAVDTPAGLLVPKVEDVDKKSLTEIACDLSRVSKRARERNLTPKDLSGAGITISNLGGIGLSGITPIVNWPQVAILGVVASQMEPRWMDGQFRPRLIMPMTLGFDHRVINGADGAHFLRYLKEILEDPFLFLL